MNEALRGRCELFIKNRDAFKAAFPMESGYILPICASIFTDCDKIADVEALKATRKLLKNSVRLGSSFKSTCELPIIAMIAVSDDPEKRLADSIELYSCLKEHFFSSEYLPVAATILSGQITRESYAETAERMKKIYVLMKNEHPFLTSSEDNVFAAMLSLSDREDSALIGEAELCYDTLKERFHDRNALQSLSFVLALADDGVMTAKDRCRDTARLFDLLRENKNKYGTGYELATLGCLATLPCGVEETARDLIEVAEFLKTQKGYGFWGIGKAQRLLHAAMIVTSDRIGGADAMSGAAVNGTLSMIAAQQAATCAMIASTVAISTAATRA